MTEPEIRALYRVASLPSWRVERLYGAEWRVVSYCGSEEVATRSLEKRIQMAMRWATLSEEDRMREILRERPA